jgi:glutathione S-transferase
VQVVSPLVGEAARGLSGLHLFHYGLSFCSQKVRMVLAEKNLGWTSHHLDVLKREHATPAYAQINPNGVVPALVHDGTTIIESSDIMEYLDDVFPAPSLRPRTDRELVHMRVWVARQDSLQRAIAVLSREFLFRHVTGGEPPPSPADVTCAVRVVDDALSEADRHLAGRTWFAGDALSLADCAWVVVVHRLARMRFPLRRHRHVRAWYRRMAKLRSFQQAVLSYETREVRRAWRRDTIRRWIGGTWAGAARWRRPTRRRPDA